MFRFSVLLFALMVTCLCNHVLVHEKRDTVPPRAVSILFHISYYKAITLPALPRASQTFQFWHSTLFISGYETNGVVMEGNMEIAMEAGSRKDVYKSYWVEVNNHGTDGPLRTP